MKRASLDTAAVERVFHNPEIAKQVLLRPGDVPHLTQFAQAAVAMAVANVRRRIMAGSSYCTQGYPSRGSQAEPDGSLSRSAVTRKRSDAEVSPWR